jgi:cytoskeletal protein CcmA (bactofilin family)
MIMAIVTITVLMLLGLAVITVSMGTLKSNAADASTNDAYYAAESGVGSGLDQLKLEVSRYYAQMLSADSSNYTGLFNNFATSIATNAQTNFSKPSISGGDTKTTFSVAGHESSGDIYEFLVSTVSTMTDGTKYQVEARLKVKRVDISAKEWFIENASLVVGNTLTINSSSGISQNGGNVYLGALVRPNPWNLGLNSGAQLFIDPTIKNAISDVLVYPSFSDPVISNPKYYITVNNTEINNSYSLTAPVSINTAANVALKITYNNPIPAGIIRSTGDMTISSGGNINCDIYCKSLDITGRLMNGNIYARGNVALHNGDYYGNIYCDGNVTIYSASLHGSIICNGSITVNGATALGNMFATGPITLSQLGATGNVIYSKSKVSFGGATINAIIFSGGDVVITSGGGVNGAIIAKNNMYFSPSGWITDNYDAASVAAKYEALKGTFFRPGGGTASLDTSVFQGQSITAIGRIN